MTATTYTVVSGARAKHTTRFDAEGYVKARSRRGVDCDHVAAAVRLHGLTIDTAAAVPVSRGLRGRWIVAGVTPAHTVQSGSCGEIWIDGQPYHLATHAEVRAGGAA